MRFLLFSLPELSSGSHKLWIENNDQHERKLGRSREFDAADHSTLHVLTMLSSLCSFPFLLPMISEGVRSKECRVIDQLLYIIRLRVTQSM